MQIQFSLQPRSQPRNEYLISSIEFILKLVVKKYRKKWLAKLYNGIRLLKLHVLDVYNAIFGLLHLQ